MATLVQEAESILSKLDEETGTDAYWTESEIKSWYNDLYVDTARQGKFVRKSETQDSVAEQDDYELPDKTLEILGIVYDSIPIYPTSIQELNSYLYTWRSESSGTPDWYYQIDGEKYTKVRLWKIPSEASKEIEITVAYIPERLTDGEEPEMPFNNSKALFYGVMAIALWKAGPGQDTERGNYYWQLFENSLNNLVKETKTDFKDKTHVFRSIHDVSIRQPGPGLPSNYPAYPWRR
jgi:hypothetical protein